MQSCKSAHSWYSEEKKEYKNPLISPFPCAILAANSVLQYHGQCAKEWLLALWKLATLCRQVSRHNSRFPAIEAKRLPNFPIAVRSSAVDTCGVSFCVWTGRGAGAAQSAVARLLLLLFRGLFWLARAVVKGAAAVLSINTEIVWGRFTMETCELADALARACSIYDLFSDTLKTIYHAICVFFYQTTALLYEFFSSMLVYNIYRQVLCSEHAG